MLLLYVFFFFKQKTAYEMRISDWSSDVCSSDLTSYTTNFRNPFGDPQSRMLGGFPAQAPRRHALACSLLHCTQRQRTPRQPNQTGDPDAMSLFQNPFDRDATLEERKSVV